MIKLYLFYLPYRFLLFLLLLGLPQWSEAQLVADGNFNPTDRGFGFGHGFNGDVVDHVAQADGKVLVIGHFNKYSGALRPGIARLKGNSQGLDSGFVTGSGFSGGQPRKLVLQPDGKILVVGSFTHYNGQPANQIIRLLPNGQTDPSFAPGLGPFPIGNGITAITLIGGGKILVAGDFTTFNGSPRALMVRLLENGSVDLDFNAGASGAGSGTFIRDLVVQPDGKILVAGLMMNHFNNHPISYPNGSLLLRLLQDGEVDNSFSMPENKLPSAAGAYSVCLASDGGAALAGHFGVSWKKYSDASFSNIYHFIKLKQDGTADQYFKSPVFNDPAEMAFKILPVGNQFLIGGKFSKAGSPTSLKKGNLAKIIPADIDNPTAGNIDPLFAPDSGANGAVYSISKEPSGDILIGGQFSRIDQKARYGLARLQAVGQVDAPFSQGSGADRSIHAIAVQPDHKLLIGGDFGYYNWNWANGLARVLANGNIDPTFAIGSGINGVVRAIALQSDGKILVGGHFNAYQGVQRRGIVRLLPTGTIDPTFDPGAGTPDTVYSIALHQNGKMVIGGSFTQFNGQPFARLVRLLPNGQVDASFQVGQGFDATVRKITLYQDSILYIGGWFSMVQGLTRRGLVRLNQHGLLAPGFNTGTGFEAGAQVLAITFQEDGKLIIGGAFSSYNENPAPQILRLNQNGLVDDSFTPGGDFNGTIKDLLVQASSQKIIAVGNFSGTGAGTRKNLIRLKSNGLRDGTGGSGSGTDEEINSLVSNGSGLIYAGAFTQFDGQPANGLGQLNDEPVFITTWNGSFWDNGIPEYPLHCKINGNYAGPGFSCRDFILEQNYQFNSVGEIQIGGNVTSQSSQVAGRWTMNGQNEIQQITGHIPNLTINNSSGVTLPGQTFLKGTLKMQEGTLTTNGRLTVVSNAAGTGRIATIEAGAFISGEVNVQRFIPSGSQGWYFLSTPVTNQTRAHWSDNFPIPANGIFLHNEAGTLNSGDQVNGWEYPPGNNIILGKGYRAYIPSSFFLGSSIVDNKGPLHIGDFSFPVSFTPTGFGGGGWNFLGNPYACEIDWHALTKQNIGGEFHIWNKNKYGTYSQGMGMGVNGPGRYIPAHQAFFVKANGPAPTLSASESAKPITAQNPSFLRTNTNDPADALRIKILDFQDNQDETAIRWMEETTAGFDPMYDAHKLANDGLSISSISEEGKKLALQARPYTDGEIIHIGYGVKVEGQYMLRFAFGPELMQNRTWYLRDNELGTIQTLMANFVYPFLVGDGILESTWRFSIAGVNNMVSATEPFRKLKVEIAPNPTSEHITILHAQNLEVIQLFDFAGKQVGKWQNLTGKNRLVLDIKNTPSGVYQLVGWGNGTKISQSVIIQSK